MKDLHVHTDYSDGKNTFREIVDKALSLGLKQIGFSDHSFTSFDKSYCMGIEDYPKYFKELSALKKEFSGKIDILIGLEQDYFSPPPVIDTDYIIGSVHYIKINEEYIPVDESKEILLNAAKKVGGIYKLIERYFELVGDVVNKTGADIVGHFDLISKFNEDGTLFDTNAKEYRTCWQKAADKLLKTDVVFEINTGAISRGYRSAPYPSLEMIEYIKKKGGKFILSSDAHDKDHLLFKFDEYEKLL